MYHVLPINDIDEHIEKSTCHCQPDIKIEGGEMICIHNAFDRRELKELCFEGKYAPITGYVVQYLSALNDLMSIGKISKVDYKLRLRSFMDEYNKKYTVPDIKDKILNALKNI